MGIQTFIDIRCPYSSGFSGIELLAKIPAALEKEKFSGIVNSGTPVGQDEPFSKEKGAERQMVRGVENDREETERERKRSTVYACPGLELPGATHGVHRVGDFTLIPLDCCSQPYWKPH